MLEQFIISIQIILIDIGMAADNAIIIGLIASCFAPQNRKKIIAWGVAAAFIFRIFFERCPFRRALRATRHTSSISSEYYWIYGW